MKLRNGLWNSVSLSLPDKNNHNEYGFYFKNSKLYLLFLGIWHSLFSLPIDTIPRDFEDASSILRRKFFESKWYKVYDIIEFIEQRCPSEMTELFVQFSNKVLGREKSAYRFVGRTIVDITSEQETESIEAAIDDTYKYASVNAHLLSALKLLSDREKPTYRNSNKEAILAVEALCQILMGNNGATLGDALKVVEKKYGMHPALKKSLSSLYGYTSDGDGIRHALMTEDIIAYADAKFMLVSCTAFTNYLLSKSS